MVMMTEEGSTKIINFITPGVGVLVLRCGQKKLYSENTFFLLKSSSLLPGADQTN